jgi:hypothetical protein
LPLAILGMGQYAIKWKNGYATLKFEESKTLGSYNGRGEATGHPRVVAKRADEVQILGLWKARYVIIWTGKTKGEKALRLAIMETKT